MLAQLSDPHIRVGGNDTEAVRALEDAVLAIAALDPAAQAVLLTGDVAQHRAPAEYERTRTLLAPLDLPVYALPGNHDDPEALRAVFPSDAVVRCGPLRVVLCDTTRPGHDDGALGAERRDELEQALAADDATPTILAMHHPPILTGVRAMDAIGLPEEDRAALAEVVGRHPNVHLIAAGHVHRAMVGRLGTCPVMTSPSVHLQLDLDLRPDGALTVGIVDEPRGFVIHLVAGGAITSHVKPIGDFGRQHPWPS